MPEHNHEFHKCVTKERYNMEPFIPTPQLATEEGERLHICCKLYCGECSEHCDVW